MISADPFAHGTPSGDDHTWVNPNRLDCPSCSCCTVGLCRGAQRQSRSCSALVTNTGQDSHDVTSCPCAPGGRS